MTKPKKTFANVDELFEHLRSLEVETPEPKDLPELEEGEYFHVEYVRHNPVGDGGYLSNMVDLAHSRHEAAEKLTGLVADTEVYAIHVRRYPQPEQGVHVYDEHNSLAVAQSQAYMQMRRADAWEKAHDEIQAAKADLEAGYDQIVTGLEDTEKAHLHVIGDLMDRIRRVEFQLRLDNTSCSYSEPLSILHLLLGVGVRPDEQWERRMISNAKDKVRTERKHHEAVDLARRTGVWPLAPFTHGGNSQERRCACGQTWHMDEVPPWHNGLECQKPTYAEDVAWAKRTGVWPVAKIKEGSKPPVRVCACGEEWLANMVPQRHNGLECQPEKCETAFNGGPCAGDKSHEGICSPHPKDFLKCVVEDCGHPEERHTTTLPEEGSKPFCAECTGTHYEHAFESRS